MCNVTFMKHALAALVVLTVAGSLCAAPLSNRTARTTGRIERRDQSTGSGSGSAMSTRPAKARVEQRELDTAGGRVAVASRKGGAQLVNGAPLPPADLELRNVVIVDALLGEFDFDVRNLGPGIVPADSYNVYVYVDGLFDSSARNSYQLGPASAVTWQWSLAYYYPPGSHNVVIEVYPDAPDPNSTNNVIGFSLAVPFGQAVANLRPLNPVITDPVNDVFSFRVRNTGPWPCKPGDYFIRVFVDGFLDSFDYNGSTLYPGGEAQWTWQLDYIYPAGLHVITIEVVVNGIDPVPDNNILDFNYIRLGLGFQIIPSGVVTGVLGASSTTPFAASGGSLPATWRVAGGTLPRGMSLSGSGVLSGTPRQSGSFPISLEARDSAGAAAFAPITVLVLSGSPAEPVILSGVLPPAFAGSAYAAQLAATGGVPGYTWTALGPLPAGLSIDPAGAVSGSTLLEGSFLIPVRVTDANSTAVDGVVMLTVLPADRFLNGSVANCRIVIPWKRHDQGLPDSDRIRFSATFDRPPRFVIDGSTRLVVSLGDYAISFNRPTYSRFRSYAVFNASRTGPLRGSAIVRWLSGNRVQVILSVDKAPMADVLASFGIARLGVASTIIPFRVQINDCDTGQRSLFLNYRLQSGNGILKN